MENTMSSIQVIASETAEKYLHYAEKITPWFIKMMQEYDNQISPLMSKHLKLCKQNRDGGYSDEIVELVNKIRKTKHDILFGHLNEEIYISAYDLVPTRFHYFNTDCTLKFIMKTTKKAMIIAHFKDIKGSDIWHKFEFRPQNDTWILDQIFLSYTDEKGPYKRLDF